MRIRMTLYPGEKGTKELLEKYGEQLLCVRYRYDAKRQRRYKTVELLEEEVEWLTEVAEEEEGESSGHPGSPGRGLEVPGELVAQEGESGRQEVAPTTIVGVRLEFSQTSLRRRLKELGAWWDPVLRLWRTTYYHATMLEVESLIVRWDLPTLVPRKRPSHPR